MEALLKPIGYHCGLTGSLLYRGTSAKDVDVIIYPRDPVNRRSMHEILKQLGARKTRMAYTGAGGKLVAVAKYKGIRVDLFFLS